MCFLLKDILGRKYMWYKDIGQLYDFQSSYTENIYEYLIKGIFDKDEGIKGYKQNRGNTANLGKKWYR